MDQQPLLLLAKLLQMPLVSIEILPGSPEDFGSQGTDNFPFLLVDGHLGIPRKILYQLYVAIVSLRRNADQLAILSRSSIILLANPAHQTALHARKRLIQDGLLRPEEELTLIALFVGSSKESAKQSTLWDHRRWIFCYHYERIGHGGAVPRTELPGWGTSEEASFFPKISLGVLENECKLIRRACELYPRNYHAWAHYHWILNVVVAVAMSGPEQMALKVQDHIRFLQGEVMQLRQWIDRHVSDYSAVHLLCSVAILDHSGAVKLAHYNQGTLMNELREHSMHLLLSYPSHETLWLYLRNTLSFSSPNVIRESLDKLRSRGDLSVVAIEKYITNLI